MNKHQQTLLIATSNAGKAGEYKKQLQDLPLTLVSLADIGLSSIEETGKTFEENARLKARAYAEQSGLPCIADDGGLEIDFLHGEPGVRSRRWKTGDENVTDQELADFTIAQMQGVPDDKRAARFRMAMVFVDAKGAEHVVEESCEGLVPHAASLTVPHGLPFNAVLYIPQFNKIRSELSLEEHEVVNQRTLAIKKLKPIIVAALLCG
ncbi:MAG TPA: non-canonical purine NTP pyrophosphatase [Candidatus Paceibacterota bacterium]